MARGGELTGVSLPTEQVLVDRLRVAGCVFAEEEARLLLDAAATDADLESMVRRRVAGEPLEYLLGWAEFCGERIAVEPGVFVPRHRTEFLVEQATHLAKPGVIAVDLCCGTGAIGGALLSATPGIEVHCTDLDPSAVRCARRNIAAENVHEGDLFDALPKTLRGRVDLILVNAPYVPSDEIDFMPAEARLYESHLALDGGPDGVDLQRRIAREASDWLASSGYLLIETSRRQARLTVEAMECGGLWARVVRSDELEATVVIGSMSVAADTVRV